MKNKKEMVWLKNNMDEFLNTLDGDSKEEKYNTEKEYAYYTLSEFMVFIINKIDSPALGILIATKEMAEQKIIDYTNKQQRIFMPKEK